MDRRERKRVEYLRSQITNAYRNVPYYQRSFKAAGIENITIESLADLVRFPFITKSDIQREGDNFLSRRYIKSLCPRSHTSGSTGQPTWTYYDPLSWIRKKYFVKVRARKACGMRYGDRIAIFECVRDKKKDISDRMNEWVMPLFGVHVFSIFKPVEAVIGTLMAFKPRILYGSPSYFFQLARYMKERSLTLHGLKAIFTSSEYLEDPVRQYMREAFQADVYDVYGSTEFKETAWECEKHEGYHINEDEVIIEIVKDGMPVQRGEVGDIVMTDIRNRAMPLIRYNIGDKGMLIDKRCSCGRPSALMKPCAGRSSEYVTLPDGRTLSPYLFTTSIEHVEGLLQYQIVQTEKANIDVNVVLNDRFKATSPEKIREILDEITEHTMTVSVKVCERIDIEKNGKFKVVKNLALSS